MGAARPKWTREAVLDTIRRLHAEGAPLTTRRLGELGLSGMVSSAYRKDMFGSWSQALREAGAKPAAPHRPPKWTRDRIVAEIRRLASLGADLSHGAAKREYQYLVVAASRTAAFGSWRAAVEAAGLDYDAISHRESWTGEKIIRMIRELYVRGEPLSLEAARLSHGSLVSAASSDRHFGSWERAIGAAGLSYGKIRKVESWTRSRIVERIRELEARGVPLSASALRRLGYRSLVDSARRTGEFESWEDALREAGAGGSEPRER